MGLTDAFGYGAAAVVLLILLQVLLKLVGSSMAGGLAVWVINRVGGSFGFHLGLNRASVTLAGLMGIP